MIEKDVKGFKGLYKITENGEIRSLGRYNIDKNGKKKFYPGRILKQTVTVVSHTTYKNVTLSKQGKTFRQGVHRLVAGAFLQNPKNKPMVNHIDNNGSNNHYLNLEWCTHQENMLHAQKQGRLFASQSAAGTLGGAIAKERGYLHSDPFIGTTVNSWKILGYTPAEEVYANKKVVAICILCDTSHKVDLSTIVSEVSKHCRICGLTISAKNKKLADVRKHTKTIINNLRLNRLSHTRVCDNAPIMEVECVDCHKITYKPLKTLKLGKLSCKHLKCGRKSSNKEGKDIVSSA